MTDYLRSVLSEFEEASSGRWMSVTFDADLDNLQTGGAFDLLDDAVDVVADINDGYAVPTTTVTSMAAWVSPLCTPMPPLVWALGMVGHRAECATALPMSDTRNF